jgi:Arylsulfotransferase (ASST)
MFERLLFKQVPVWVLVLLAILAVPAIVLFGALVRSAALGFFPYGALNRTALAVAEAPATLKEVAQLIVEGDAPALRASEQRFPGQAGFSFAGDAEPGDGFLLLSRYDGDRRQSVVELHDLAERRLVHSWVPDMAVLEPLLQHPSRLVDTAGTNKPERIRMFHPLPMPDGGLVVQNTSPLIRLDACARPVWTLPGIFHHSSASDGAGGMWVSTHLEPQTVKNVKRTFIEDSVVHISGTGEVISTVSVPRLLEEAGHGRLVWGGDIYSDDPLHLNDVEPVRQDGPYWKAGDLLLSLRNASAIALYRPAEERIVWVRTGPWVNQHDVDVVDDRRFSVFDNHRFNGPGEFAWVEGANGVLVHDLETGQTTSPWGEALASQEVRTVSEGLADLGPDGGVMVEETNYGRLLFLDAAGEVRWSYVNRAADDLVYHLTWSRLLSRAEGEALAAATAAADCP